MPEQDARTEALRAGVRQAQEALGGLEDAQRQQQSEPYERLEAALAYASLIVERTDPRLLGATAHQQLVAVLGEIAGNPAAAAANPDTYADRLLDWVSRLPAATDREWEQAVREAAGNFRRSTSQHLNAVDNEVVELRSALQDLRTEISAAQQQSVADTDELRAGFEQRLASIEDAATTSREQIDAAARRQQQTFEQEQAQREEDAKERWAAIEERFRASGESVLADLDEMRTKTEGIVGAVGTAAVANHFGNDADRERKAFWWLFGLTVLFSVLAVGAAALAATNPGTEVERFIGKLALSAAFGAVAAYTGSQARDRRSSEKRSRRVELELKVFGPFIEPLPEKEKIRERIIMTRRTFGQGRPDDEPESEIELLSDDDELSERRRQHKEDAA